MGEQFYIVLNGECSLYLPVTAPYSLLAAKFYGIVQKLSRPRFGDEIQLDQKDLKL